MMPLPTFPAAAWRRGFAALASGSTLLAAPAAEPPVITRHPLDQTVPYRSDATFAVEASGTPPLTYVWHRSGRTFRGWNQRTLPLRAVTERDLGSYTVTVSNVAGSVTSAPVELIVLTPAPAPANPAPAPPPPAAPAARSGGAAAASLPVERLRAGERLRLEATADGEKPFRFQWYRDGRPLPGATAARLEIAAVTTEDAGVYACVVANAAGERASLPVIVEVRPR